MGLTITQTLPLGDRRGWTGSEFERLVELGFFAPDEKVELIACKGYSVDAKF